MKKMRSSRDIRYLKRKKNVEKLSISTSHHQLASLSMKNLPKTTRSIEQISTVDETTRDEHSKRAKERLPTLAQTIIARKSKMSKVKEQPYFEQNWREAIAKKLRTEEAARRRNKEVMKKKTLSMRRYTV